MSCIEAINKNEFDISEVYKFSERLSRLYPNNQNVQPKIRQKLQELRDVGYLDFLGGGKYRLR